MKILADLNIEVKNHMSTLDDDAAEQVKAAVKLAETKQDTKKINKDKMESQSQVKSETSPAAKAAAPAASAAKQTSKMIKIKPNASIRDVAEALGIQAAEAVKALIAKGMMLAAPAPADDNVLDILGAKYGVKFEKDASLASSQKKTADQKAGFSPQPKRPSKKRPQPKGNLIPRAPVVAVMGHVDHGKTTLLDTIRHTRVTDREAGGITQHIGASVVRHEGRKIVFLDTPGHEAFTAMRARGAQATDIVILVVAADDGIMPQTREAIAHVKAANVPIIVAVNKIDKPNAKPERVRQQLSDVGLVPEEWGGDVVMVDVSAKQNIGIENLLEMVLLLAEMQELKADPTEVPSGVAIEAELDKGKGSVATIIVQNGTLRRGDIILFDTAWGKIRAIMDANGKNIDKAGPSTPVTVLGLTSVPQPGESFKTVESEQEARNAIAERQQLVSQQNTHKASLEGIFSQIEKGEVPQLNLVIKCDVQGSVEAVSASLEKLATNEVGVTIVHKGVGRIAESDVTLALASNAVIIGFNVRPDVNAKRIAEDNGVEIRFYDIIFNLLDDVKSALEGLLLPALRENVLGEVEVRKVFKVPKVGRIAGCYVKSGLVKRSARIRVIRSGVVCWDGNLSSLRRIKDEAREVTAGFECGISLAGFQDFEEGDILEVYEIIEEKRHL